MGTNMMVSKAFVKEQIATFLKAPAITLREDMPLNSLIADSFMVVEMMIELQELCGVRFQQDDLREVKTLGDLTSLIETRAQGA
jgi:acyl carrier protein